MPSEPREYRRRTDGCRLPDDSIRAPILWYSLAQLRMRVRPALERAAIGVDPVHVALFGGTNTGKSTVLNVLLGRASSDEEIAFLREPGSSF